MTEDIETSSREPAEVGASASPQTSRPQASSGDGTATAPPEGATGATSPTQEPAAGASSPTAEPAAGGPTLQERAAEIQQRAAAIVDKRPEVGVGAAFGGGLILALILKRLAR